VQEPAEERYLTQVRIVRRVAMVALYDALSEAELRAFPQQKLTVGGLIGKFIETEQQRWGTTLSPQLNPQPPTKKMLRQSGPALPRHPRLRLHDRERPLRRLSHLEPRLAAAAVRAHKFQPRLPLFRLG
jgi:hypothetical protein